MINIDEITNNNYNYSRIKLINPFNSRYALIGFDVPFYLKFPFNCKKYYNIMCLKMTTTKYIKFLEKIYKNENLCSSCKSKSKSWCGYCHEFFCVSCFGNHLQKCELNPKMVHRKFEGDYYKQINKINSIDDIPKNWNVCLCNKNEALFCCKHGLRCKNCLNCGCNDDYEAEQFRFYNLDVIFLKKGSEGFDIIKSIENDVKLFNENVTKIFLEYKEEIEKIKNESRKKRIIKHFMDLRKDFISYQKLKLIVINVLRKEPNINLLQMFYHFVNYKLTFNKFIYSKDLSLDENLSKLSNFFATQKPIIFSQKEEEKIYLIDKYLQLYKKESKNEGELNEKESLTHDTLPEAFFKYESTNINEVINYLNSTNIFTFYDKKADNLTKVYYIQLYENIIYKKSDIFQIEQYNDGDGILNRIYTLGFPKQKLSNNKWIFKMKTKEDYYICLLQFNEFKNIFELQIAEKAYSFEMLELINNKFIIYEKKDKNITKYKYPEDYRGRINVVDINTLYMEKTIIIPFDKYIIEKLFYLKKYKNFVFVSLSIPLLDLLILNYELNQINTIIEFINPIYPYLDLYYFRPYIYDIEELKDNKILLIGNQHFESDYPPNISLKYYFKLILNLDNFVIEMAENYET